MWAKVPATGRPRLVIIPAAQRRSRDRSGHARGLATGFARWSRSRTTRNRSVNYRLSIFPANYPSVGTRAFTETEREGGRSARRGCPKDDPRSISSRAPTARINSLRIPSIERLNLRVYRNGESIVSTCDRAFSCGLTIFPGIAYLYIRRRRLTLCQVKVSVSRKRIPIYAFRDKSRSPRG